VSAARRARGAGVNVPLFSARSSRSWGIGELPDLVPLASWAASAGFDRLMLLPLGTMPDGETSPYAASSTMSIDPVFIAPDDVSDFTRVGGIDRLSPNAIEARAEAFNAFNWFNPGLNNAPVTNWNSVQFGQITSADDPRIMQFALKYSF